MKYRNTITKPAIATLMLLIVSTAHAEYQLTAFSGTMGFSSINSGDTEAALRVFENRTQLDFWQLNNLCVAQVMANMINRGIATCEEAIAEFNKGDRIELNRQRKAIAVIYSNLGAARAMVGDIAGANTDLERALSLDPSHKGARTNATKINSTMESLAAGATSSIDQ